MPTYQYHCDACGVDFEVVQSFSDDSIPKCPERPKNCKSRGTSKIRKVFSAPGITFKGSGFYKNDARGSSSNSASSSSSSDSSTSSDSESKSTDTKKPDARKSDTQKPASKKSESRKSDSKKKSDS